MTENVPLFPVTSSILWIVGLDPAACQTAIAALPGVQPRHFATAREALAALDDRAGGPGPAAIAIAGTLPDGESDGERDGERDGEGDGAGIALCATLRAALGGAVPIWLAIAPDAPFDRDRAFAAGATDSLTLPLHPAEVAARLGPHLAIGPCSCHAAAAATATDRSAASLGDPLELQRLEARLHDALEVGQISCWEHDLETDLVSGVGWVDDGGWTLKRWQMPAAEAIARIHPSDRDATIASLQAAIARGEPFAVEHRQSSNRNRDVWILVKGRALTDAEGQPRSILGISIDVTDRKQSELALEHLASTTAGTTSDAFFRALVRGIVETLGVAYAFVARYAGDRCQTLAFWARNGFRANFAYDLETGPLCRRALETGYFCCDRQAQERFPNAPHMQALQADSYLGIALHDREGRAIGLLSVMDVRPFAQPDRLRAILQSFALRAAAELERQQTQQVLAERETQFRQLAEHIQEVFFILDARPPNDSQSFGALAPSFDIVYLSPGFEALAGLSREVLERSPDRWLELFHPDDRAKVLEAARQCFRGTPVSGDYRLVRPQRGSAGESLGSAPAATPRGGGEPRWLRVRGFPVREGDAGEGGAGEGEDGEGTGDRAAGRGPGVPFLEHRNGAAQRPSTGACQRIVGIAWDITDQTRARCELQNRSRELEATLQAMPDLLLRIAADGTLADWRAGSAEPLRYLAADGLGRSVRSTFPGPAGAQLAEGVRRALYASGPVAVEFVVRLADGPQVYESRLARLNAREVLALVRNVTERREAERLLRESERRYATLAEISPAGIAHGDREGNCIYVNRRCCEIVGREAGDLYGDRWQETVHPEDRAIVVAAWQRCTAQGQPSEFEYRVRRPDGETRWVLGITVPEFDDNGAIAGFAGSMTDITDRKTAELALGESEERFRRAFDEAAAGMALVSCEGNLLRVNRAFCQLVGRSAEALVRLTVRDISHPSDVEPTWAEAQRVWSGELPHAHLEKRYVRPDGSEVWALLSISTVRGTDSEPRYFIVQMQEIADLRAATSQRAVPREPVRAAVEEDPPATLANDSPVETLHDRH